MQYQKLTGQQKSILKWRTKRNKLVAKLLAKDKHLSSADALRMANKMMMNQK